jgi:putative flippase GtrA
MLDAVTAPSSVDRPRTDTSIAAQAVRFAMVGGIGFVVDVGLFNLLRAHGPEGIHGWAIAAKTVAVVAAIAVNWIGNRVWTFRSRTRRTDTAREAVEFFIASVAGSLVALACLGVSHYGLHLTSAFADNISANVVGLVLGSLLRFVAYRQWVFRR